MMKHANQYLVYNCYVIQISCNVKKQCYPLARIESIQKYGNHVTCLFIFGRIISAFIFEIRELFSQTHGVLHVEKSCSQ